MPLCLGAGAYSDPTQASVVTTTPQAATSADLPAIALPTLSQLKAFFDALPHPAGATSARHHALFPTPMEVHVRRVQQQHNPAACCLPCPCQRVSPLSICEDANGRTVLAFRHL